MYESFFKGFVCKECEDSLSHRVRSMTKTCPEEQRQEGRDVFSIFCKKLFQVLQMRMDFLRKCHLKNLSMVLWGPRPLAFLEGGEEGESRLIIKSTQKTRHFFILFITSLVDIVVKSYYFAYSTCNMQRPHVNSFYSNNLDEAVLPFGLAFTSLFWQETGSVCKQK